jgi:AcrR family transcriptional regulator
VPTATEKRILRAAASLLAKGDIDAVTTRAVCKAAGITAPTLYHHFGDKDGLLKALVAQNIETFMDHKRSRHTADALADLKRGWYGWIDFAGENPKLFRLMIESTRSDTSSTTIQEGFVLMREIVERLSAAGRLTADVDTAARTIWAASNGILTLFMDGTPPAEIKRSADVLFNALTAELVRAK